MSQQRTRHKGSVTVISQHDLPSRSISRMFTPSQFASAILRTGLSRTRQTRHPPNRSMFSPPNAIVQFACRHPAGVFWVSTGSPRRLRYLCAGTGISPRYRSSRKRPYLPGLCRCCRPTSCVPRPVLPMPARIRHNLAHSMRSIAIMHFGTRNTSPFLETRSRIYWAEHGPCSVRPALLLNYFKSYQRVTPMKRQTTIAISQTPIRF